MHYKVLSKMSTISAGYTDQSKPKIPRQDALGGRSEASMMNVSLISLLDSDAIDLTLTRPPNLMSIKILPQSELDRLHNSAISKFSVSPITYIYVVLLISCVEKANHLINLYERQEKSRCSQLNVLTARVQLPPPASTIMKF